MLRAKLPPKDKTMRFHSKIKLEHNFSQCIETQNVTPVPKLHYTCIHVTSLMLRPPRVGPLLVHLIKSVAEREREQHNIYIPQHNLIGIVIDHSTKHSYASSAYPFYVSLVTGYLPVQLSYLLLQSNAPDHLQRGDSHLYHELARHH